MAKKTKDQDNNFSRTQNRFLKALKETLGNITGACVKANISRQTYYNWMNDDEFAKAVDEVNESNLDYAESKLLSLIRQENATAIIFYLKTKGKKRGYIERVENDLGLNAFEDTLRSMGEDEDEDDDV